MEEDQRIKSAQTGSQQPPAFYSAPRALNNQNANSMNEARRGAICSRRLN